MTMSNTLSYASEPVTQVPVRTFLRKLAGISMFISVLVLGLKQLARVGAACRFDDPSSVERALHKYGIFLGRAMDSVDLANKPALDVFTLLLGIIAFALVIWQWLRTEGKLPGNKMRLVLAGTALICGLLNLSMDWPHVTRWISIGGAL